MADLCRLVLTKNLFIFDKTNYLQIHDTAMGTRMAPSYANLLIGKPEREFQWTQDKIPRVWWRYTDNIFAIWAHGEPALQVFILNLNRHHPTIKFTASWDSCHPHHCKISIPYSQALRLRRVCSE